MSIGYMSQHNYMLSKLFLVIITACHVTFSTAQAKENNSSYVKPVNELEWGYLNPARGDKSPAAANVWGDRTQQGAAGILVKFNKGFSSPPHIHNVTYKGLVIKGSVHNDDPTANYTWLPAGSFWTQPAGESHITAANDEENLAYIEIESGPYLVKPAKEAFDNGERSINVDQRNLVWLAVSDIRWIQPVKAETKTQISFLWGNTEEAQLNGSLLKLPVGFKGKIVTESEHFRAVMISGEATYKDGKSIIHLLPASSFGSEGHTEHQLITQKSEALIYIRTKGKFSIEM